MSHTSLRPRRLVAALSATATLLASGVFGFIVASPAAAAANPSCAGFDQSVPGQYACDIPVGTGSVAYTVEGASGGGNYNGGGGAIVGGVFTVTPGQTLYITVGTKGEGSTGGNKYGRAGGGGGYSAIALTDFNTDPWVVAGGGGGSGGCCNGGKSNSSLNTGAGNGGSWTTEAPAGTAGKDGGAGASAGAGGRSRNGGAGENGGAGGVAGAPGQVVAVGSAYGGGSGGNGFGTSTSAGSVGGQGGSFGEGGGGGGGGGSGWAGGGGGGAGASMGGKSGGGAGSSLIPATGASSFGTMTPRPGVAVNGRVRLTMKPPEVGPLTFTGGAFGTVSVGANTRQTVTATNTGQLPAVLSGFALSIAQMSIVTGADAGTCVVGYSIPPGGSCTLVLEWNPIKASMLFMAGFQVQYPNAAGATQYGWVSVTGEAVTAPGPLTFAPTDFGSTQPGTAASLTLTVKNTGAKAATPSAITVTGANVAKTGGTCATAVSIPASGTCTLTLKWTPAVAGALTGAAVTVAYPGGVSPTSTASLTGNASTMTFGSVGPDTGSTGGGQTITINGTGFVPGTTVTVGGQPCTNVVVVSSTEITCQTPPHPDGTVDIVLTSGDAGTVTGPKVFTYQQAPVLTFAPTDFGQVMVGSTVRLTVTATNTGTVPVDPSGLAAAGTGLAMVSWTCPPNGSIPVGDMCMITLDWTPTSDGPLVNGELLVAHPGAATGAGSSTALTGTAIAVPPPTATPTTTPTTAAPSPSPTATSTATTSASPSPTTTGTASPSASVSAMSSPTSAPTSSPTASASPTGSPSAPSGPSGPSNPLPLPTTLLPVPLPPSVAPLPVPVVFPTPVPQSSPTSTSSPSNPSSPGDGTDISATDSPSGPSTPGLSSTGGLVPGRSVLLADGQVAPVTVVAVSTASKTTGLAVQGDGWSMTLSGRGDAADPGGLTDKQVLVLRSPRSTAAARVGALNGAAAKQVAGPVAVSTGTGFMPNSPVRFFLLADTYLGSITTNADGTYSGEVPVPAGLAPGEYTLQVNGLAPNGQTRSLSIGVLVEADDEPRRADVSVFFDVLSSRLSRAAEETLDALLAKTGTSGVRTVVVGFVQPVGPMSNDEPLSTARAQAVAAYLKAHGLEGAFTVRGDGRAVQTGADARRVDVTVTYRRPS